MASRYTVKQGDCISSIAFEHGFFPSFVWEHEKNAELRAKRESMYVLEPGDEVYIPDKRVQSFAAETGKSHVYRRKGVPEKLRLRFLDEDGDPRAGIPYVLEIGSEMRRGKTDAGGMVVETISPGAKKAVLQLGRGEEMEEYELNLGHLLPVDNVEGVQQRLNNLGYSCGEENGELGEKTRAALREFQGDHGLQVTGEMDEETGRVLKEEHAR